MHHPTGDDLIEAIIGSWMFLRWLKLLLMAAHISLRP